MEVFILIILAISLSIRLLSNLPRSSFYDEDYISNRSHLSGSDRQRSIDADLIIQSVISNTRTERLEHLQQQLVELDRIYQDLQSQLDRISTEINFLAKLNPFSNNPQVIEWRDLTDRAKDTVTEYNSTVDRINHEIESTINNIIAIDLMCLATDLASAIQDLHHGIGKLSATGSYSSSYASVNGKGRLVDSERALIAIQNRLNRSIVKHYGAMYDRHLARGDIIHAATRAILRSIELPENLK